ncbi:uncharacterized protein LOC114670361 [Macaca mulatta]
MEWLFLPRWATVKALGLPTPKREADTRIWGCCPGLSLEVRWGSHSSPTPHGQPWGLMQDWPGTSPHPRAAKAVQRPKERIRVPRTLHDWTPGSHHTILRHTWLHGAPGQSSWSTPPGQRPRQWSPAEAEEKLGPADPPDPVLIALTYKAICLAVRRTQGTGADSGTRTATCLPLGPGRPLVRRSGWPSCCSCQPGQAAGSS